MCMANQTAEILCVGTELLLGDIVNTNAAFLSKALAELGFSVYHHSVVGDNPKRLKEALTLALSRADVVLMSGGLGPTKDDLTKESVAEYFGLPMEMNKECLEDIRAYFRATGRVMTQNNEKQAIMPRGAVIFKNNYGTAPALAIEGENGKTVIMLPGPPVELIPIYREMVLPYLKKKSSSVIISRNVHIFGIGESATAQILDDIIEGSANPTVAPYCEAGEVRLRVTARAESVDKAILMCDEYVQKILQSPISEFVYGVDVNSMEEALVNELHRQGKTLAAAESCTGGLIAKRITDISGCSDVFFGGCVTYTNEVKQRLLGVKKESLDKHGAVSSEVAMEMARGVRERLGSDIGISATGIAGPTGGTEKTPVGTVYLGISTAEGDSFRKLSLSNKRSRDFIRNVSATNAYDMVLKALVNNN